MGVLLTVLVILVGFVIVRVSMVAIARQKTKHKDQGGDGGGGWDPSISYSDHDSKGHSFWRDGGGDSGGGDGGGGGD